jgi:2-polyprenyl-6-methoxyphenol hydroxylase-like FAD-dependent oxidoreductase
MLAPYRWEEVAKFPDGLPEPVNESWGMAITGQGVACFMSLVDETNVVRGLSRMEPEPRPKLAPQDAPHLLYEAGRIGYTLRGPFPAVLEATDPQTAFSMPAWDKQPFLHDTTPRGAVFIGDSNHAVSPFAGNGANLALKDGWDLAAQLCQSESLDNAVTAHDKLAYTRAVSTLKTSHQRIGMAQCSGLRFILYRLSFGIGRWLMWLTRKS